MIRKKNTEGKERKSGGGGKGRKNERGREMGSGG